MMPMSLWSRMCKKAEQAPMYRILELYGCTEMQNYPICGKP
uniref:Uncharacterized protein n=2 Tax=Picea TaxID=3328 RepID=A0A117NJF6_PICGL|nr:hypothetical protein ABT39_MTgene1214 [Picea glauca]QHR92863.1 hypothetical protein Q903MT_gene6911 [Picea sitchensis]